MYIRGKHKPNYDPMGYFDGDKVIVVNMKDPLFTGRKRLLKLYRHHTGYPGGLKEKTFKEVLEKDPDRILKDAIQGMLPKNKWRKKIIAQNVVTYFDQYHDFSFLPQFTDPIPEDLNPLFGRQSIDKENSYISMIDTHDGKVPEEFADLPVREEERGLGYIEKTHSERQANLILAKSLKRKDHKDKRYKVHKPKNIKFNLKK